jgi:hypothetical protein
MNTNTGSHNTTADLIISYECNIRSLLIRKHSNTQLYNNNVTKWCHHDRHNVPEDQIQNLNNIIIKT